MIRHIKPRKESVLSRIMYNTHTTVNCRFPATKLTKVYFTLLLLLSENLKSFNFFFIFKTQLYMRKTLSKTLQLVINPVTTTDNQR